MGLMNSVGGAIGFSSPEAPIRPYTAAVSDEEYARQQELAQQSLQGGQGGLMAAQQAYRQAAAGNAPSVAQVQLQQGQQNAALQANQMAASARGGAGAGIMAQRQAMTQQAMGAQNANAQAAHLRAEEMAQARQGLASVSATQQQLGQQYGAATQGQKAQEYQFGSNNLYQQVHGNQAAQLGTNQSNAGILNSVIGGIVGGGAAAAK